VEYSPVTYYTLGTVYPRWGTRKPYPRRRRRLCIPVVYHRPFGPVYSTACTVRRIGETAEFVREGETIELTRRGLACEVEIRT
jgi:hypothetical protein